MNPDVKAKWVEALRSGEYKQGFGILATANPQSSAKWFCCLGVLCDLAVKDGLTIAVEKDNCITYGGEVLILPDAVIEWAGLEPYGVNVGIIDQDGEMLGTLVHYNDGMRMPFREIADIIEKYL